MTSSPSLGPGGMPDGLPVPMLMVVQADTSVGDPSTSIQDVLEDLSIDGDVAGNAGYAENVHGARKVEARQLTPLLRCMHDRRIENAIGRKDLVQSARVSLADNVVPEFQCRQSHMSSRKFVQRIVASP